MSIQKGEEQTMIYDILTRKVNIPLPNFVAKQIIFMLQPKTIAHNPNFEDELHLEKSFRLIDKIIYYSGVFCNGSYPKGEDAYEAFIMSKFKKQNIWYNKIDLIYVYNNLKKCGCCKIHSCGVLMEPHNTNIKTHKTYRTRLQNNYHPFLFGRCSCCCRHNMRWILREYPEIEPKPQIFNVLQEMANEELMTI